MRAFQGEKLSQPFDKPAEAITAVLKSLAQANAAQRLDLDWQAQNQVAWNVLVPAFTPAHLRLT
jgi:hypothetical protein